MYEPKIFTVSTKIMLLYRPNLFNNGIKLNFIAKYRVMFGSFILTVTFAENLGNR